MDNSQNSTFSQIQVATWHKIASKERFPGKVATSKDGSILIRSFITLPVNTSTSVLDFRLPDTAIPVPKAGDFVTFRIDVEQLRQGKKRIPFAYDVKQAKSFDNAQLARHLHQKFIIASRECELEILEEELKKQKAELEAERAQSRLVVEEQINKIESQEKELDQREENLQKREEDLSQREFELNQLKVRLSPYLPNKETRRPSRLQPSSDFSELFDKWLSMLGSAGHISTKDGTAELGFLLCLLCTLSTGGLVILDGPVGVGKSSIVKRAAMLLTEGDFAFDIVPVRPGWIDSTDLVGFYDTNHRIYQPSPFLTALNRANCHDARLHLICLDELNLARIENYGADLLSCLEYRSKQKLPLYSPDIEDSLKAEFEDIVRIEESNRSIEQNMRGKRIAQMLELYKAELKIPDNAIFFGTLNSDETTYDISPKVIDRSFVIRLPSVDFVIPEIQAINNGQQACFIDVCELKEAVEANLKRQEGFKWLMSEVARFQQPLKQLGIPLGHRVRLDLTAFTATAQAIGLADNEMILKYFLFSKVLPRIRCQRNDRTTEAWQEFQKIIKPYRKTDSAGVIENIERQWNDPTYYTVRYFDTDQ
jgi:hypothetical protein